MVDNPAPVNAFHERLAALWSDLPSENDFWNKKPLLAHYTSLNNLESILRSRELWFANPTLMNDRDELEFGLQQGMTAIVSSSELKECFSADDYSKFISNIEFKYRLFVDEQFPDTYIFCTSEIDRTEIDGRLSMWRAYGVDGNGVAIVFDTGKIKKGGDDAPMQIVQVEYRTNLDRLDWLKQKVSECAKIIKAGPAPEGQSDLFAIAFQLFERIKSAALLSKHKGFEEEREWRVIYTPSGEANDILSSMRSYSIGPHGVEPRLKLNIDRLQSEPGPDDVGFKDIICNFILGPTRSTQLNLIAFKRILAAHDMSELSDKVYVSTIPYRPKA